MPKNNLKPITLAQCKIGDRIQYGYEGTWKWIQATVKEKRKGENGEYCCALINTVSMPLKEKARDSANWVEESGMWFLVDSRPVNSDETFKSKSGKTITCKVKHVKV